MYSFGKVFTFLLFFVIYQNGTAEETAPYSCPSRPADDFRGIPGSKGRKENEDGNVNINSLRYSDQWYEQLSRLTETD